MFAKSKTMKGVIASFTTDAKAILEEQKKIAAAKQVDIDTATAAKEAALNEAAIADAFITNLTALAVPADCCIAKEVCCDTKEACCAE